jgi:hypothetical protein
MRIAAIGQEFKSELVTPISFNSTASLLDYDCVLWNPNTLMSEYATKNDYKAIGYWNLNDDKKHDLLKAIERRKHEIQGLLEQNRAIIIAPSSLIQFSGGKGYVNVLSTLPIPELETMAGDGSQIECKGNERFSLFLKANPSLKYHAHFLKYPGKPIFYIRGTDKVVGFQVNTEKGLFFFLPFPDPNTGDESGKNYIESLVKLIADLKNTDTLDSLPNWADSYRFEQENILKQELQREEDELQKLQSRIYVKKHNLAQLEQLKHLFVGSGNSLEKQVEFIFKELGFTVKPRQENRDDLIVEYDGKTAIVEIKGVTKSAAEKNAAQLEKWVSEYIQGHEGITPKGILIVNAIRDKPLEERNDPTFPNQMLKYSSNREHCLMSGLQLFGLYLDFLANPNHKDEIINKLFTAVGIFKGYEDWQNFITKIETDEASA